jgi:glyoxylase-like metal-dependent hydrolase (beta-lactamase superfamily II)
MAPIATPLGAGLDYFDLRFLGEPGIIATGLLSGHEGVALIDPGPSTTLGTLKEALASRGISLPDVRAILLTHIHLDHAGATGSLIRECPNATVLVHEAGLPHLVNPSKLVASAARLYGADMGRLWGEILPVPQDRIQVAAEERLRVVGHSTDISTPPSNRYNCDANRHGDAQHSSPVAIAIEGNRPIRILWGLVSQARA